MPNHLIDLLFISTDKEHIHIFSPKSFNLIVSCTFIINKRKRGIKSRNGQHVYCLVVEVLLTQRQKYIWQRIYDILECWQERKKKHEIAEINVYLFGSLKEKNFKENDRIIRHRHNVQPNVQDKNGEWNFTKHTINKTNCTHWYGLLHKRFNTFLRYEDKRTNG